MHNQLQSVCSFISFTLRSFIYSYNQLLRFLYLGISDDDIGHRVALRLLGMDNSLCGADVSKLLLFGEGIVGEIVQETLEIFDSLENRTTSSTSCGRGFSVRFATGVHTMPHQHGARTPHSQWPPLAIPM